MHTRNILLTGDLGRSHSLCHALHSTRPGVRDGLITYCIQDVPVDVPIFDVLHRARKVLDSQASPVGHYTIDYATLYATYRR